MANIEIKKLSLVYTNKNSAHVVFDNLSINFGPCGLIGILGESGSGKSSLLNLLAKYQKLEKGEINIDVPQQKISVIFQDFNLINHLNVEENVALPLILSGMNRIDAVALANVKLNEVGIGQLAKRQIDQISGGQQARVSLARSIILNPQIILADEPTGSLDRSNSIKVIELLKNISHKRLVLMVTHDEELAYHYCSQIYKIFNHKLVKTQEKCDVCNVDIEKNEPEFAKKKIRLKENIFLSFSFLKKRLRKVVLMSLFCSLCFALLFMVININQNGRKMLDEIAENQVDYNCVNLVEKRIIDVPNQDMSLVKKVCLSPMAKRQLSQIDKSIVYYPCLDSFLKPYTNIQIDNQYLKDKIFIQPCFPDQSRIVGNIPQKYSDVIINENLLTQDANIGIGTVIHYENDLVVETNYLSSTTNDILHISIDLKIVGIAKTQNIISRPSVYYDYIAMYNFLESIKLNNASKQYAYDIFLSDRLSYLSDEDDSLTCFKTIGKVNDPLILSKIINEQLPNLKISNTGLDIANSIDDLISSFSQIIVVFIILILICSFFLEMIFIRNLYDEKRKEFAIYLSFHIKRKEFMNLGMGQVVIITSIIVITSSLLFFLLSSLGNIILGKMNLPLFLTINLNLLYFILLFLLSFGFALGASLIPLNKIYSGELISSLRNE